MRPLLLLMAMFLAGCASGPSSSPDLTTDEDVLVPVDGECPLTYPDGSPMACDVQDFVPADSTGRPSLADGWRCTHTWGEDGLLTESYNTAEGRVGFYWEWERWKEDGLAYQRLGWYEGAGIGESLHVPYQTSGFVSLPPQDPSGSVEIHQTVRQYRVHALIDGEWVQPGNVTFLLDNVGGDTWWAVRFDWPGGPYYVSTMEEDREEGRYGVWDSGPWRGFVGGSEVIIDSTGNGIKYLNVDFTQRRAAVNSCGLL